MVVVDRSSRRFNHLFLWVVSSFGLGGIGVVEVVVRQGVCSVRV